MPKVHTVTHRFIDQVPSPLEEGVIYVSIPFGTVVHRCCCGCGDKVVTPLTPVDWAVVYNGQTVSLYPSIGRWDARCQSHYWIRNDRVIWSDKWSRGKVENLKRGEESIRDDFFGLRDSRSEQPPGNHEKQGPPGSRGWFG